MRNLDIATTVLTVISCIIFAVLLLRGGDAAYMWYQRRKDRVSTDEIEANGDDIGDWTDKIAGWRDELPTANVQRRTQLQKAIENARKELHNANLERGRLQRVRNAENRKRTRVRRLARTYVICFALWELLLPRSYAYYLYEDIHESGDELV